MKVDIIRIVACCMIVLMHSPHPNAGNPGFILVPLSFITSSGIGLFFMVSGALLLSNNDAPLQFIKKRLSKVIFPTLFWTLFYLGLQLFTREISFTQLLRAIPSIPFSVQGHGVLWFMYVLIGLYLLTPVLSAFLQKATRRDILFYLILWAITLCFPLFKGVLDINDSTTGILYYFSGFAGYYVMGYYMKTFDPKISFKVSALLITIPVVALLVYGYLGGESLLSSGRFGYLSITVALMSIGWYSILKHLTEYAQKHTCFNWKRVSIVSDLCFGVYLMHIFVMRYSLWKVNFIVNGVGGIGQICLTWILTLFLSFFVTYLLSRVPRSELIIGTKIRH